MGYVKAFLVFGFVMLIAAGCSTTGKKVRMEENEGTVTVIRPSGVYEDCFAMEPGQTMDYSFSAKHPLEFNVHYHVEGDVQYPVQKVGVKMDEGTYKAGEKNYYCLMWTNHNSEPVWLTYACKVK